MVIVSPVRERPKQPLVFLAGPIMGAGHWQNRAVDILSRTAPDVDVANPRRDLVSLEDFADKEYFEQADWEHDYLEAAAAKGVILFWLARQGEGVEGRSYAQTTRFELGEAVTMHQLRGTKVVVGFEEGFSNARYLKYTLAKKMPGIPLCETLEATVEAAVRLARGN